MSVKKKWVVEIEGEFEIEHHAQDFVDYLKTVLEGQDLDFEIQEKGDATE